MALACFVADTLMFKFFFLVDLNNKYTEQKVPWLQSLNNAPEIMQMNTWNNLWVVLLYLSRFNFRRRQSRKGQA